MIDPADADTQPMHEPGDGIPPPGFDASHYPRRYRPGPMSWVAHALASLAMTAGAIGLLLLSLQAWQREASPARAAAWALAGLALLSAAGALLQRVSRRAVLLDPDAVHVLGEGRRRTLTTAQLTGRRRVPDALGASAIRLEVRSGHGKSIDLPDGLATDLAWDLWMNRLPDLDAADVAASLRALEQRGRGSAQGWLRRFAGVQRVIRVVVAVVASLVLLSLSRWPSVADLAWAVLMLLPPTLILVVLASGGVLRMDRSPNDVRPSLLGLFGIACAAPWPRLAGDVALLHPVPGTAMAAAAGLIGATLLWWLLARRPALGTDRLVSMIPLAALYLCGAALWTNQKADGSTAATHRTVASYKGYRLGQQLHLFLRVEPWAEGQAPRDVAVPATVFNQISPGQTVCVDERGGRLGWPWLQVQACPATEKTHANWPQPLYRALRFAAHAAQDQGRLAQWLRAGRIDEVEAELQSLQQRYETGQAVSTDLLTAYRDFYDPDPELDDALDQWVSRHPASYPARLARGTHRKFQAIALGNAGYARWVSPEHNEELAMQRQVADLLEATQLTAKPGLAYLHLLDTADYRGQREQFDTWLARGMALDPADLALHRKALFLLSWKGPDAPRAHLAALRAAGASPSLTDALQAILLVHEGKAHARAGRTDDALAAFRQAQTLKPWHEDLAWAMAEEAYLHTLAARHGEVESLMRRALTLSPDHARCHAYLGWALQQQGRTPEAVTLYRRAAELGDAWAQGHYGRLLLEGRWLPQDGEAGARWITRAAGAGDREAVELLRAQPALRRLD